MGRIIAAQFITIDEVVEDPDGSDGTPFGGWALRHGREAIAGDKFAYGPILQSGVFLFGRRTWQHFSTLWPGRDDPFARALNAAAKAVVTRSQIDPHQWQNTSVVRGDILTWAREEATRRDVVIIGSGSLLNLSVRASAVDEYRLRVFPTAAGSGRRLFPDGRRLNLTSIERLGPTVLTISTPAAEAP